METFFRRGSDHYDLVLSARFVLFGGGQCIQVPIWSEVGSC